MYLPDHHGSIGVFDSGIGGLSVANAICGLLPRESQLYVADNARAPYGARTDAEVLDYSRQITEFLLAAGVKLVVVACNTATSVAIDALRASYPDVPFVGLEPAVKPAAAGRHVGIMATAVTLRSARYLDLRARYLSDRPVWEDPCAGLVPLIEAYGSGSPEVGEYLRALLPPAGVLDTLVLGCTHYPLILEDIRAVAGPGVHIIDPSGAAARQVQRLLERRGLCVPKTASGGRCDFHSTGGPAPLQRTLLQLPLLNKTRRWVTPYLAANPPHGHLSYRSTL
ncbi:Glutamate racemase [Neolewinella maritima]|uniref:Glutamate racemase n=1 Tax=Neolewinella maritima TaxID=1383882 RepID=A0ABM9B4R2_9BACT|nr:glutamate racemase [Neolewinella maritima]CAH1002339.1 Glutamate racemase [Neolewinella maritima]